MNSRRWLFVCSCIALVTSAFTFIVRGDVLQDMGNAFNFTEAEKGGVEGAVFLGMAFSMFFGGFICDVLGMKRILMLAFLSHLTGSLGTIFAPHNDFSYYWLYASSMLMGFGNGFTEVGINPLVATMYSDKKTHYLNILHAWWPGGLVIGGILARLVGKGLDLTFIDEIPGLGVGWQVSLCLIAGPAIVYGLMLLPAQFPQTERVASGVSTADMFKECLRPLFLVWAFCMLLTAATELGPQKWQESVIPNIAGVSGTLVLVYTSGMMFVLRHFAGPIAHKISPVGMMAVSSVLSAVGLYLLSTATNVATVFGFATIFGLGIAYFWPTMLGFTAERFPKGGALALALMGSAGNISISQVLPLMGGVVDDFGVADLKSLDGAAREAVVGGPAESADKLEAVRVRLGLSELRLEDVKSAYSDPELVAKFVAEERKMAVAELKSLVTLPESDPKTLSASVSNAVLVGLLHGGDSAALEAELAALDAPSTGESAAGSSRLSQVLDTLAAKKGAARAHFRVHGVNVGGALNVEIVRQLEMEFLDAMMQMVPGGGGGGGFGGGTSYESLAAVCTKHKTAAILKEFVDALRSATTSEAVRKALQTGAIADEAVLDAQEQEQLAKLKTARAKSLRALTTRGAVNLDELWKLKTPQAVNASNRLFKLRIAKTAQAEGYSTAFKFVSALPSVLIVVFVSIILYDRSRGGYKAEVLDKQNH